ncbi:MAG TPA: response regulator transcription factor [Mycobacteriales bacterium]|nr:response regulator transcription factor [Mycobacteriales bacterium]
MPRLLVVEDDDRIRLSLRMALEDEGYTVRDVSTAEEGLAEHAATPADLVLVDLMLPGMDGFDCIRSLRKLGDVPIVVVSARDDTHDVVAALEAGADDYVVKPVAVKELSARLRALRRRARGDSADAPKTLRFGEIELRPEAGEVALGDDPVHLTRTEFRLLCELADQQGRVLSRQQLLDRVWGYEVFGDDRLVDVHVGRLRRKIERDPANPKHLLTVRGLGYKLQV